MGKVNMKHKNEHVTGNKILLTIISSSVSVLLKVCKSFVNAKATSIYLQQVGYILRIVIWLVGFI